MNVFDVSKMTEAKKTVITALLVCVGIVLQIAEGMFDIFVVPGGKIGLANVATLLGIFIFGGARGTVIAFLRALLGCILYGGVPAMPYSISGAVLSALCMWGLKKAFYPRLSCIGISALGAFVHNGAQIVVAAVIFQSAKLFTYLPVLVIIGTLGGILTGIGTKVFLRKTGL